MSDLNKLKDLAKKATPGPWAAASDWERAAVYSTSKDAHPKGKRVVCSGNQNNDGRYNAESWSGSDWNDAAFIAAANPSVIINLIERLEAAEARLANPDAWVRGLEESLIAANDRAEAAEAELERLMAQEPIMFGITDCDGKPYFDEICVDADGGLLADVVDSLNEVVEAHDVENESCYSVVALYTAAQPAALPDYFAELVAKARHSAEKAMISYPQPNYVLLKFAEEAGEVVQAGVHYAEGRETWEALEGEVVQTIAMLYRLVTEGDQVNGVIPPNPIAPGE